MKRYRFVALLAASFFIGFGLLSKYEDRPGIRALDFAATVKVQERIDSSVHLRAAAVVGNVMEGATFFASPGFTVAVTLLVTLFWIYDRKNRRWNVRALGIPIALALLVAVELYGKSVVHHPSPAFAMIKHPVTIFPANYVNEQFSYPSGHAARAVFLSVFVFFSAWHAGVAVRQKRYLVGTGLGLYIAVVLISRIYLGHHWLSDVVGGLLLGLGMGVLTWVIVSPYNTETMSD